LRRAGWAARHYQFEGSALPLNLQGYSGRSAPVDGATFFKGKPSFRKAMTIYPVFPQFFAEELERPMPMLRRCSQTANQDTFWRGRPLNHLAGMVHFPAIGAFEHNIPVLVRVSGSQYAFFCIWGRALPGRGSA